MEHIVIENGRTPVGDPEGRSSRDAVLVWGTDWRQTTASVGGIFCRGVVNDFLKAAKVFVARATLNRRLMKNEANKQESKITTENEPVEYRIGPLFATRLRRPKGLLYGKGVLAGGRGGWQNILFKVVGGVRELRERLVDGFQLAAGGVGGLRKYIPSSTGIEG